MVLTDQVWVVATLRADFYSRCSELPERFRDLFVERGGLFPAGGPRPPRDRPDDPPARHDGGARVRAPRGSAGRARRCVARRGLRQRHRPSLLEFTLDELWRRSAGSGVLRFSDYEDLGGLQGAIKIRAEEEFARLPAAVRASLRGFLPRSCIPIRPTSADPAEPRFARAVLEFARVQGADRRLRLRHTVRRRPGPGRHPGVGLAHEALLREWPPAVQWIEQSREMLRLRAGIAAAAALWRNSEYDASR
jgi:hypothetical protein